MVQTLTKVLFDLLDNEICNDLKNGVILLVFTFLM